MTIETPLEELRHLTAYLGGPRLLVKRDDKLPFGGSKFRKAIVLVEHAAQRGATVIVTEGSVESQHARTIAIAARKRGMRCVLALTPDASGDEPNLLDDSEGAEILLAESEQQRTALVGSTAAALQRTGEIVEVVPFSGTNGLTTLAYMHAFEELLSQSRAAGVEIDAIYLSSATGGIHAGLELGRRVTGSRISIVGVTPGLNAADLRDRVAGLVRAGAELSGRDVHVAAEEIRILDQYVGDGYLKPTEASRSARALVRDLEGLELDAVYTAKTMAALIDQVRLGAVGARDTIVYWHSSA